nr:hypothetical protein [Tanacetum cinerariifolium]
MALPPRNERHAWHRFDTHGYTKEEILDFETWLEKLYYQKGHRVQTLDFGGLIKDMDQDIIKRLKMQHKGDDGQVILEFFSTLRFREGVLDLEADDIFQF